MNQVEKFDLKTLFGSLDNQPLSKFVFCTADHLKLQVMRLRSGGTIPPCKMENDVIFILIKGEGKVIIDNEIFDVCAGDCIIVPHTADSRSIKAESDMEILAVHGFGS